MGKRDNINMPYIQINANLWAVMRYPKTHPVAMIVGLANQDNVPLFFVQTWHPEPSRRRVISQHDTLDAANQSVLWDMSVVEAAQKGRVDAAQHTGQTKRSPAPTQ